MNNLIKSSLDLFIGAAVIFALVQDFRSLPSPSPSAVDLPADAPNPI